MKNKETKDFIAYEYLSINVNSEKEPLYIDCYENFGWILTNNTALIDKEDYYINNNLNDRKQVNLKFKRDRKIKNKVQLLSLQRKLESSLKEMERLEKEPEIKGIISAMTIGMLGTIFLAISVFAITATNPIYFLSILFGIPGIIGWILPYFAYRKVSLTKETENITLIDEQYNNIYDTCEQARKLID